MNRTYCINLIELELNCKLIEFNRLKLIGELFGEIQLENLIDSDLSDSICSIEFNWRI